MAHTFMALYGCGPVELWPYVATGHHIGDDGIEPSREGAVGITSHYYPVFFYYAFAAMVLG